MVSSYVQCNLFSEDGQLKEEEEKKTNSSMWVRKTKAYRTCMVS